MKTIFQTIYKKGDELSVEQTGTVAYVRGAVVNDETFAKVQEVIAKAAPKEAAKPAKSKTEKAPETGQGH